MNNQIDAWVQVGEVNDIPVRGARCVQHEDTNIALFRSATDEIFALEDRCPHKQGPLSQGIVHDDCVTCPLHNWVISLKSGEAQGADSGKTRSYPVKIVGKDVLLGLPQ